jgi:Zn-dependent protease with chaperone function
MNFWTYWLGQYAIQSVMHSFLIAIIVEILLRIWQEHRPSVRLRFLFLTLWIPVISFPLFQLINPERGSYQFRNATALFDLNAWMLLRFGSGILLWHVAIAMLMVIAFLFLIQDFGPMIRIHFQIHHNRMDYASGNFPKLEKPLQQMRDSGCEGCQIILLHSEEPILYSTGSRNPAVYVSSGLLQQLDEEELAGVLAHEVAHIQLKDHSIGWILLIFRILSFFNPVALVEFRRILQEREMLCDDHAVNITRKPLALASGLVKFFRMQQVNLFSEKRGMRPTVQRLRLHSQRIRIEDRIQRLVHPRQGKNYPYPHFRIGITALATLFLLFYVV